MSRLSSGWALTCDRDGAMILHADTPGWEKKRGEWRSKSFMLWVPAGYCSVLGIPELKCGEQWPHIIRISIDNESKF